MAMPTLPTHREWTVEMLHALPDDGNRYEVIEGELFVSPAPALVHQRASRELVRRLLPYLDAVGDLELLYAPAAVTWSPRTEVQPDILVLPLLAARPSEHFEDVGVLELAVEILSPSTARADRYRKRALYQERRVPEYWIVDTAARMIERWRPNDEEPAVLLGELTWQPRARHAPLAIELDAYFRAVHGE
jgi:Uma2 family endonuclease